MTYILIYDKIIKNMKGTKLMKIKESAENYLEAILMIKKQKGAVRSIDIAHELNFSKPSVSVAMKALKEDGYITIDPSGMISLTEKGTDVAESVYERHQVIASLLIALGVSEEVAYEDSCKIEHVISLETFLKLKEYNGIIKELQTGTTTIYIYDDHLSVAYRMGGFIV